MARSKPDHGPTGEYVGIFRIGDPREVLGRALKQPGVAGCVIVKADEIKAILRMRVCRATQVFTADEDGPITPTTAHCVEQAGHDFRHSNGYFTWEDA